MIGSSFVAKRNHVSSPNRVGDMKLLINPGNAGWIPPPEIDAPIPKTPSRPATLAGTTHPKKYIQSKADKKSLYNKEDKSESSNHAKRHRFSQDRKPLPMNHELGENESTWLEEPFEDLQTEQNKSLISEGFADKNDLSLVQFFRKHMEIQLYNIKGMFNKEWKILIILLSLQFI